MKYVKVICRFFGGIDLHSKSMVVCIMDQYGNVLTTRRIPNRFGELLKVIAPYRQSLALAVESTFNWYWLVDACRMNGVEIHMGHAYYMKSIHVDKHKNDKLDARKIAGLLRVGLLPYAHACSAEMRPVRDLLRQRQRLVHIRSSLLTSTKMNFYQFGDIDITLAALKNKKQRAKTIATVPNPHTRMLCSSNMDLVTSLDGHIQCIERELLRHTHEHYRDDLALLRSVPGIGPIIGLTILYEIDSRSRFHRRQDFSSYCRLVNPDRSSDNKTVGHGNRKCGSPYLKWAFMEIISNAPADSQTVKSVHDYLITCYEPLKARAVLANHFCTVVYYMLKHKTCFDEIRFARSFPEAFSQAPEAGHLQRCAA